MKSEKHEWTSLEDTLLVAALLDIYNKGTFNADNGFKHGYLDAIEEEIRKHLPSTDIKAKPNIESRLKTLKGTFSLVYDMLYGTSTSGFGWDPDNKFVTAETPVWEEYLKGHPKAKKVRNKRIEHFETLCIVYGKDHANGRDAQAASDIVEEINEENENSSAEHRANINLAYDMYMSMPDTNVEIPMSPDGTSTPHVGISTNQATTATQQEIASKPSFASQPEGSTSNGKRKRRSSIDNSVVQVIREVASTLGTHIEKASHEMSIAIGTELKVADRRSKFYEELRNLEGLNVKERHLAGRKLGPDDSLIELFFSLPHGEKAEFVKDIIGNP